MKSIKLERKKLDPGEQKDFEKTLRGSWEDKETGTLIFMEEDGEVLDAILVPASTRFTALFEDLKARKSRMMEFKWGDPELSAQLGMCLMQHVFSGGRQMLLLGDGATTFFGLVPRDLYEQYR